MVYIGKIEDIVVTHRSDGYVEYRLPNSDFCLFRVHMPTLNSFNMTEEEKALGLRLCLEARVKGSVWFGDILKREDNDYSKMLTVTRGI